MTSVAAEEPLSDDPQSAFHHSRMLFSQLGLTSWDKRRQVHLLKKSDRLLRELKNLDNQVGQFDQTNQFRSSSSPVWHVTRSL